MKCPKCGYLGFEHADRCRNCGYDFSLASMVAVPELPLKASNDAANPLDDFALDIDPAPPSSELPLFGGSSADDEPLITRASPPRPPLAVRRATPEVPRIRADQPRMQSLDLALDLDSSMLPVLAPDSRAVDHRLSMPDVDEQEDEPAGLFARLVAGVIDVGMLATIDLVVVYFTMQVCGLTMADIGVVPKAPLLAFIFVQNVGYLVAFTASGQTLGKMATGIKVVPENSHSSLDLGRAMLRTALWLALLVPAGLGFLPALFSRDHRGLHDRFAGTRVVRLRHA